MGSKFLFFDMEEDVIVMSTRKNYGCLSFLGDLFMVCITGGLWLIWIFVREMRNR
jgi:hypothetical protein